MSVVLMSAPCRPSFLAALSCDAHMMVRGKLDCFAAARCPLQRQPTPSMPYSQMTAEDVAFIRVEGRAHPGGQAIAMWEESASVRLSNKKFPGAALSKWRLTEVYSEFYGKLLDKYAPDSARLSFVMQPLAGLRHFSQTVLVGQGT